MHDVFDDDDLAQYVRIQQWPSVSGPDPKVNPSAEFRELLRFVADNFELPNLMFEVDAGSCAWSLHEDKAAAAYDDDVEKTWRFVFEFYMDVGRALCETLAGKGLARVSISTRTSISEFQGMGAWLEREVTGKEVSVGKIGTLPAYHDLASRLQGRAIDRPNRSRQSECPAVRAAHMWEWSHVTTIAL